MDTLLMINNSGDSITQMLQNEILPKPRSVGSSSCTQARPQRLESAKVW